LYIDDELRNKLLGPGEQVTQKPPSDSESWSILLAEDNPGDVFLVRRALEVHQIRHELRLAKDGEQALEAVRQAEAGVFPIDLILVDLNLPRYDGGQIVLAARSGIRMRHTPIILLTSSDSPHDRRRITELGANLYFRKPSDLGLFMEIGEMVKAVMESRRTRSLHA
jgi:chemotaxis family two-component system response regulator Rcp1